MHAIQIRNVPDKLYNQLKKVSKMHHRTLSGETLAILEKNLFEGNSYDTIFSQISSVREEIKAIYGVSESSLATIEEDRAR